jgi:sugar/nucleoside kinase (ribokinase family)
MCIEKAATMAVASASLSVTRMGAQNSAPQRMEIEQFIASHVSVKAEAFN